jgi:hypothetical protein
MVCVSLRNLASDDEKSGRQGDGKPGRLLLRILLRRICRAGGDVGFYSVSLVQIDVPIPVRQFPFGNFAGVKLHEI